MDRHLALASEHGRKPRFLPGGSGVTLTEAAQTLVQTASAVEQAWEAHLSKPFMPMSLTLYPHNRCSLACPYCFSGASPAWQKESLSLNAVCAAAQTAARNCLLQNQPMTVVFHGGGEPALDLAWVSQALEIVEAAAANLGVSLFKYIATNGVMSERRAGWLAEHFDLIGLSCDGPEEIQSIQRPLRNGRSSSMFVERTARMVRQSGKPLHVRVTVTPAALRRQTEIAQYLCEEIQPQEIDVEPVYRGNGNQGYRFQPDDANEFVEEFFRARQVCRSYHIPWQTSGVRLNELHDSYCQIHRSVLQLIPGGCAAVCYEACDESQARQSGFIVGKGDHSRNVFQLDSEYIRFLQERLAVMPVSCAACFNRFHCNRACPDHCALTGGSPKGSFRCLVNLQIAEGLLLERASQKKNSEVWLHRL
ncbi:radical SAM protein [Chloroflexi bacterium CFX2]|nr:radical SAM protein [Chloroflexi bacterium CFX2]